MASFRTVSLRSGLPVGCKRVSLPARSQTVRIADTERLLARPPLPAGLLYGPPGTRDHNVKKSPRSRTARASTTPSASSGGFFDNKLPPQPAEPAKPAEPEKPAKPAGRLQALLTPLSDPVANKRLLALFFAQTLCSVATLIHDTYLPVYLQDVLGMSNQKVPKLTSHHTFARCCWPFQLEFHEYHCEIVAYQLMLCSLKGHCKHIHGMRMQTL